MANSPIRFEFDPIKDLKVKVPRSKVREAREALAEYLLEQVLIKIGQGKSPVTGRSFPKLNKDYADREHMGRTESVLELSGDMLSALEAKVSGTKVVLEVPRGSDEADRAEGNNLGTYGQASPIAGKARKFIPLEDEFFSSDIERKLKEFLEDYVDESGEEE